MRRTTQWLLIGGLALEVLLGLFPPMRVTIAPEAGDVILGRTEHFFVLSPVGGAWTIDSGRLLAEAFLIAMATLLLVLLEGSLHGHKLSLTPSQQHQLSQLRAALKKIVKFVFSS